VGITLGSIEEVPGKKGF